MPGAARRAASSASSTTWPTCATRIERDARRRAAGAGARRRLHPRRLRPRARRAARHQPLRQAGHRGDGRARAGAHRHQLAQGPLQPRLRLLHRDPEVEPARGARRLPPQADDRRRRALHHAGAEGVRGEGPRRRRADPRARAGDLRRAAAQVAAEAPRVQDTARALATLDVARRARPRPRAVTTTPSRTCTTATSCAVDRRAPSGRRAAGRRAVRAERHRR